MPTIRKANADDIPLIRELSYKIWPQTYASMLSQEQIEYMLDKMYSAGSLQEQMDRGTYFILVYEGNEPTGFAAYFACGPSVFKLDKLYVLSTNQGKGTGRFMIDHIVDEIKQSGATALQLQVNRHNDAKKFYEKLGFVVVEEKDFDIGHGFFMNDFIMERKL